MTSTYHVLIVCFMSAEHALADPSLDKFMGKAFVHAAPAAGAMRSGTTKLGVQPSGKVPAISSDAEAHIALGNPGPLANMEREVARLKDEDVLVKSELQHFRPQIETMDVLQNQKQGGPEAVESSLLADLRLWACFVGAAAGVILYFIIGKLRNSPAGVTATSACLLDGAEVHLASVEIAARGGRSGIPMMEAAQAVKAPMRHTSGIQGRLHQTDVRKVGRDRIDGVKLIGDKPNIAPTELQHQRDALAAKLESERRAVERSELKLAELDSMLAPEKRPVLPCRGYLSKTAGCYNRDGASGPPPSALKLALDNFGREVKELTSVVLPYRSQFASSFADSLDADIDALSRLTLSNDAIWARERARPEVPAPLLIKLPYLTLCSVLDTLFDGRPIARFWYLETVARIPYFGYNTMIFLYETLGWWRRSAAIKKVHFQEEWNEFHHLLIMESLGGDQKWFDRFIGQHSALAYYFLMTIMWVISPTLAYNFSELIEAHAVDTYAEFIDANEQTLRELPPPDIACSYYQQTGGERGDDLSAPLDSLYDVFCRIRDDEASHVDSMKECQDPEVRSRARIVEVGSIALAAVVFASTAFTVETVDAVEKISAPYVTQVERSFEDKIEDTIEKAEERVEEVIQHEEADFEQALREAETGLSNLQGKAK